MSDENIVHDEIQAAWARVDAYKAERDQAIRERDEAQIEVERLRKILEQNDEWREGYAYGVSKLDEIAAPYKSRAEAAERAMEDARTTAAGLYGELGQLREVAGELAEKGIEAAQMVIYEQQTQQRDAQQIAEAAVAAYLSALLKEKNGKD